MNETVSNPTPAGLIERAKAILLKPSPTWDVIADEPSSIKSIYMGYVVPLAAITPIASAIGMSVFGINALFVTIRTPLLQALVGAVVQYALALGMVYVLGLVIDGLAPSFGGEKNPLRAFKLAAYSSTASWLAGIFAIFPSLGMLGLLGVYSLYLLFIGLPKLMKSPADKSMGYTAVIIIVMIVLGVLVGAVSSQVYRFGSVGNPLAASSGTAKVNGTVSVPGMGTVDLGKAQAAAEQMAAQASAAQNGQVTVKTADPQALLDLMPQSYMGAARSDTTTSSDAAGGMAASTASASYSLNGGTVHLKISDLGSMGGFGAMAQAVNVNHTETTATGYEKVSSENGRVVSEKYDNQNKSGEYSLLVGTRISVEADGSGVDMATLKAIVGAIDLGKAQSLAK